MAILRKTDDAATKRRAKAQLQRQAAHEERMAAFNARVEAPLTKDVAFSICRSVYGATGCACEKRPEMAVCSTMTSAALGAIGLCHRALGQSPSK